MLQFPISYSEELVQPSPSLPFSASRVSQTECIELHEVEATIGDLPFAGIIRFQNQTVLYACSCLTFSIQFAPTNV